MGHCTFLEGRVESCDPCAAQPASKVCHWEDGRLQGGLCWYHENGRSGNDLLGVGHSLGLHIKRIDVDAGT